VKVANADSMFSLQEPNGGWKFSRLFGAVKFLMKARNGESKILSGFSKYAESECTILVDQGEQPANSATPLLKFKLRPFYNGQDFKPNVKLEWLATSLI